MFVRPTPNTPYGRRRSMTHMHHVRSSRYLRIEGFYFKTFIHMVRGRPARPPTTKKGTLNPKSIWLG